MKKITIVLLTILCLFLGACRKAKSDEDYQKALDSIELGFDVNNFCEDSVLPAKTKKFDLDILWTSMKIAGEEENYVSDCASIDMNDGKSTLVNKIEYDDDYDNRKFGKITLTALVADGNEKSYSKEFIVTVWEKVPSLNYTIAKIKEYCATEKATYIETKVTLAWVNEIEKNRYNLIVFKNNEYIFVNNAFYDKLYNLKAGDEVYVKGVSGTYNGYPIVTYSDLHDCTVELINKGKDSIEPMEMDYNDFAKLKDTDGSIYLNKVKFRAILKGNDANNGYTYRIEGTNNKELVVNVSNYSFAYNLLSKDNKAKRSINNVLGKETTITAFIFINVNGVWEVIILPSELK